MLKLTTAILATASVALTNATAAQALTTPIEAFNPEPTFPTSEFYEETEEELNFGQTVEETEETELAYFNYICQWFTYPNGYTEYVCYYY